MKKISIIIPCRNEEASISELLDSILQSDYDLNLIEVIIVDGLSSDNTINILRSYIVKYNFIKIILNQKQKTPYAFNLGINNSSGDLIVIIGARHIISKNYLFEVSATFSNDVNNEIGCVGGKVISYGDTFWGKIISKSMSSKFGVGFDNFRTFNSDDKFVDTIGTPCFRKSIFDEVGFFDEKLTRNQDDDFSYRLIKAKYKILHKGNIFVRYKVRSNLRNLFKQYYQYGFWKVFVNKKHEELTTYRQIVPLLFVLSLIILTIASIFSTNFLNLIKIELSIYILLSLLFSLNQKNIPSILAQIITTFIIHLGYGVGYLLGVIRIYVLRNMKTTSFESLSR